MEQQREPEQDKKSTNSCTTMKPNTITNITDRLYRLRTLPAQRQDIELKPTSKGPYTRPSSGTKTFNKQRWTLALNSTTLNPRQKSKVPGSRQPRRPVQRRPEESTARNNDNIMAFCNEDCLLVQQNPVKFVDMQALAVLNHCSCGAYSFTGFRV